MGKHSTETRKKYLKRRYKNKKEASKIRHSLSKTDNKANEEQHDYESWSDIQSSKVDINESNFEEMSNDNDSDSSSQKLIQECDYERKERLYKMKHIYLDPLYLHYKRFQFHKDNISKMTNDSGQ